MKGDLMTSGQRQTRVAFLPVLLLMASCSPMQLRIWAAPGAARRPSVAPTVEERVHHADLVVQGTVISNHLFKVQKQYKGDKCPSVLDIPSVRQLSQEFAALPDEARTEAARSAPRGRAANLIRQRQKRWRKNGLIGEELVLFLTRRGEDISLSPHPSLSKHPRSAIAIVWLGTVQYMGAAKRGRETHMPVGEFERRLAYRRPILVDLQTDASGMQMLICRFGNLSTKPLEIDISKEVALTLRAEGSSKALPLPAAKWLDAYTLERKSTAIKLGPGEVSAMVYLLNDAVLQRFGVKRGQSCRLELVLTKHAQPSYERTLVIP